MTEFVLRPQILHDRKDEEGMAERVLHWWARLTHAEALLPVGAGTLPPAVRAILRRSRGPADVLLSEGFRTLWLSLPPARRSSRDLLAWGCVAAVLAEVDHHEPNRSFATAMAAESETGAGRPRVSELRFQQLLHSSDLDELTRRARRAVHLLRKRVHVVSLADDLLHWHREKGGRFATAPANRLAVRWANDYFTQLASYQRNAS